MIVDIKNPVKILGDSKFLFYCLSKGVPRYVKKYSNGQTKFHFQRV